MLFLYVCQFLFVLYGSNSFLERKKGNRYVLCLRLSLHTKYLKRSDIDGAFRVVCHMPTRICGRSGCLCEHRIIMNDSLFLRSREKWISGQGGGGTGSPECLLVIKNVFYKVKKKIANILSNIHNIAKQSNRIHSPKEKRARKYLRQFSVD